jgi:UDP-glucose 4-epimerase
MRVTITGGAGFIGANLVRTLEWRGWDVTVLDDLSNSEPDTVAGTSARLVRGCVTDPRALEDALAGADAVVHLAACTSVRRAAAAPEDCHRRNVTGSVRLLQAARDRDLHLVFASSAAVYGDATTLPISETAPPAPIGPYGESKLAMEEAVLRHGQEYALRTLVLRLFNVLGPYQHPDHSDSVVPRFVRAALAGQPMTVFGDGTQTRDFVPVSMVCAVIDQALEHGSTAPAPVNVASGTATSVLQIARTIAAVCRSGEAVEHRTGPPGEVRHSCGDPRGLRKLFPTLHAGSVADELERTVRWHELSAAATAPPVAR